MGNIVSKVPLKDGTVRYLADSEARTRVTTLETLIDGHSVQANVPQDAVFTDTVIQYNTLPAPSAEYAGQIYQYTGETDANYTSGYFYKCVEKVPTAKYTAPDGNTYKHKITGTGQPWYTVYTDKKICFVDNPSYYRDNDGVRVYKPFGISSPNCGLLETEERTNTAIFRPVYPSSSGWNYNSNYKIFLTDSTVPSSTAEIWFPVSGNEETPVVSSAEAAYNYLTSPDLIYVWERVDVQPEPAPYTLPAATESTLGGIKVGDNLSINNEGVLSAEDPDQYSILPIPSAEYANRIVQYVGETNENFTNGYFYKCIIDTNAPYTGAKLMAVFNDAMDQQYENVALFNAIVDRWSQDTTLQCGFYAVDPSHCGLSHSITTDATWMYFSQTWYRSDNLSPSTQTTNWQTITSDGSQQHGNKYVILDSFYNDYPGFEEYKWEQVNVQDDQNTVIQYEVLPTPSAENEDKIYQYIGEDTADYDNGYFYKCEKDSRIPEEGSYDAPDGNTYKTKMTATSYWALTVYTNRKYCFVEGRSIYYDNVKQYMLCVADKKDNVDYLGYISAAAYQTDAEFNSFYPGSVVSQWTLSDTKVYNGTSAHTFNSSFGYSRAAFPNVPYFTTEEEALAYLLAPDYQWKSIGVQNNILFGVCNTNRNIAEKVVSIPNLDKLVHGTQIRVLFDYPNADHGPTMTTLNVNNLGAYQIVTKAGTLYQLPTWKSRVPVSFTFYEYPNDDPVWILEDLYEPTYVKDIGNDETIEGEYPELEEDIERYKQPGDIFKIYRNDTNDAYDFIAFKPTGWDEMYGTLTDAAEKADAAEQDLNTGDVTVTGNTVNFTTRIAQKAKEIEISLEPIQDLHGYDGPWPAGGGKNKWGNGNISGTAYSDITLASSISAGTYTLSAMVDSTDTDAATCLIFDVTNNTALGTIGRSTDNFRKALTFTTADAISTIRFYASASSEQSVGDALYFTDIQLEEGSTATALVPYSNECLIDGYTEASLIGCGKNLVKPNTPYSDNPYEYNGCTFTLHDDGSLEVVTIPSGATGNATYEYNKELELPADTYEFLGCPKNAGNKISFYLNSGFTYKNIYDSGDGAIFTISEPKTGKLYLRIDSGAIITTPIVFKPMVTTDLTATYDDFESYTISNDLTLQFGEKVYSANVDVESGTVTINKGYAVYDGSEDEDWHKRSSSDTFFIDVADMENGDELDGISNLFTNVTSHNDFGIRFGDEDARIYLYQLVSQISEITDLETFKTYLSNHNLQVVYPLAIPRTIQLTPNEISLLSGVNVISTDADGITLTYRNGKIATIGDLDELNSIIKGLTEDIDAVDERVNGVDERVDELEELAEDTDERVDAIEEQLTTDTATVEGNPLNFTTLSAQKAVETVISLEPIQDLHGYDHPWPAGGGKNKFQTTASSSTASGIASTVNDDGSVSLQGTSTESVSFVFGTIALSAGSYIMNGCPSGGSSSTYRLQAYATGFSSVFDNGNGIEFTVEADITLTIRAQIRDANITINNTWYPMIRLATETDPTFAPYSNYCPIDGRTEMSLVGCGKNELPMTVAEIKAANTNGTWNGNVYTYNGITWTLQSDGTVIANGTATANSQYYIPVSGLSGNFYYNGCPSGGGRNIYDVYAWDDTTNTRYYKWDETTTSVSDYGPYDSQEIDIPEDHGGRIICRIYNGVTANNILFKPMIRLASNTDATYEPYVQSNDLTIQFGEKVYGATVELEKGTVTVEWGYIASYNGETLPGEWISDRDVYAPNTSPSTGAEVAYELASPRTITLTPNEISLLLGVNVISTDGDSISLTYRDGKVATLGDLDGLVKKIADCEDVEITDLQDGHSLVYDSDSEKWVNSHLGYDAPVIYSTEEREIGVWTDGKPLYQKTITGLSFNTVLDGWANSGASLSNVDKVIKCECGQNISSMIEICFARVENTVLYIWTTNRVTYEFNIINILYTKTTDEPGSGKWTTMGMPTVHYDNTERVIGTWFGETLYQKSYTAVWQPTVAEEIIDSSIIDTSAQIRNLSGTWAVGLYGYEGSEQADIYQPIYFTTTSRTITPPIFKLKSNGFVIQRSQSDVGIEYSITIQYTKSGS